MCVLPGFNLFRREDQDDPWGPFCLGCFDGDEIYYFNHFFSSRYLVRFVFHPISFIQVIIHFCWDSPIINNCWGSYPEKSPETFECTCSSIFTEKCWWSGDMHMTSCQMQWFWRSYGFRSRKEWPFIVREKKILEQNFLRGKIQWEVSLEEYSIFQTYQVLK